MTVTQPVFNICWLVLGINTMEHNEHNVKKSTCVIWKKYVFLFVMKSVTYHVRFLINKLITSNI